jgi:hypothetical protein
MLASRNMLQVVERTRKWSQDGRIECCLQSWVDLGYDEAELIGSLIAPWRLFELSEPHR